MVNKFKYLMLGTLKCFNLTTKDLISLGNHLKYPDLVNMLVKSEGVGYFSEICSDYLEDPSFNSTVHYLSLKHVLSAYVVDGNRVDRKQLKETVSWLTEGLRRIHALEIKNVVVRDNEYRKLIKDCVPTVTSIDTAYLIALLQQIANNQ